MEQRIKTCLHHCRRPDESLFMKEQAPPRFEETSFSFKVSESSPKGHPHNLKKPGLVYGKAQKSSKSWPNIPKIYLQAPLLDGVNGVSSLGFLDGWPLEHRSSKRKYSWQLASAQVIVIVQRINTLPKINIAFSKWCLEHYLLFSGRHNNFRCEVEVSGLNPSPFECRE